MQEEKIHLIPHDPLWSDTFQKEKQLIQQTLGDWVVGGIEHVGSTAIPGISAKPIIDIMVGVENLKNAKECIPLLEKIQYHYYPYKSDIMIWFCKPNVYHRKFHLYLIEKDSPEWTARITFRDYLQSHDEEMKNYEKLKQELAEKFGNDRESYTAAKAAFVLSIVDKARK